MQTVVFLLFTAAMPYSRKHMVESVTPSLDLVKVLREYFLCGAEGNHPTVMATVFQLFGRTFDASCVSAPLSVIKVNCAFPGLKKRRSYLCVLGPLESTMALSIQWLSSPQNTRIFGS